MGDCVFCFIDLGLSSSADHLCISKRKALTKIPDNVSFDHTAASLEGAHYAINFINKAKISAGH